MATFSPARKAAFQILLTVERGQAHADDLLRSKSVDALSAADRNLTTALVLGVLRWQIRLDQQIREFIKKPNAKLDAEIRIALRLGAFQLLHLDRVPVHAAIDESVELAKRAGHRFASGMVNALLRKLAKAGEVERKDLSGTKAQINFAEPTARLKSCPDTKHDSAEATSHSAGFCEEGVAGMALDFAHPTWMVERWAAFYGMDAARAICAHGQSQPAISVRVEDAAAEDELRQAGIVLEPGTVLAASRTVVAGDVTSTAAFLEGRVRVQDEGSQLVGELAAYAAEAKNILDACAAPGGKTLILAERNPLARVVACEQSPQRFAALRERLASHAAQIECRLADASALEEDSVFDLVLADVPCSGTGTLGRNPEIRHRLRVEDLARHAERQRAILRATLRAVRPGGCVVYSTCSLEPEENEQVVAAVLTEMPNARQVSLAARVESLRNAGILTVDAGRRLQGSLTAEGAARLLPCVLLSDGFFVTLIQKATADPSTPSATADSLKMTNLS